MGPGGTAAASQLRNRHKGGTRDVQRLYNGCTRDTQGTSTLAIRYHHPRNALATGSPQARVSLNALTSRAGQFELRPANLRCI